MAQTQICCQYDGSFAGFLSCVFYCYVNKEAPCEFRTTEDLCCSLYPLRAIETNETQAKRVYRSLALKMGTDAQRAIERGFLSCLEEKELWLWRFIQKGYTHGHSIMRDLADPTVHTVLKAVRFLGEEAHLYTGFVRFSDLNGVLVSEIEPKNRVLPLMRAHFCSRYPQERFVIHDRTHREVLLHVPGQWRIFPVEEFHADDAGEEEQAFRQLWRSFYRTISIEGRYNPRCRQTHMPKRYWNMMTEFQDK